MTIASTGKLRSTVVTEESGKSRLLLSGAIDERSDLPAALHGVIGDVVINLEGIERINSIGVHRWIPAFAAFAVNRKVEIERLSYPLVLQANMVANLFGQARVLSCVAPYFCSTCKENRVAVVNSEDVGPNGEAPERSCTVCAKRMSFDELDNYFTFFNFVNPQLARAE